MHVDASLNRAMLVPCPTRMAMCLIGAVPFGQDGEWPTASRCMMVKALAQIDKEKIDPILCITPKAA